jgi:transposase
MRQFGREVDGNARRGPNISPLQRSIIIAKRGVGASIKELAAEFGRSESAIKYTLRTYANTTTTKEKPRSGRPLILSLHQKKIIYRKVRATPKIEYLELAEVAIFVNAKGTPLKPPSCSTLYWYIKRQGLTNFPCKKRPKLNCGHALKRLQFCRQYC